MNYYNELDPFCANWLYNLIQQNLIPPGDIDMRDIRDVKPTDLRNYKQCHFFAGISGWPLALALAGVGSDEPLWTGSCPCQPFSAAGRRGGFSDERHLWPSFYHLIAQCRPPTIFGEQVASAADWLRLVRGDLEALEYAVGAMPIEAASAGADHLRDRFFFVADSARGGCAASGPINSVGLADANSARPQGRTSVFERPDQRTAGTDGVDLAEPGGNGAGCRSGSGAEPEAAPDRKHWRASGSSFAPRLDGEIEWVLGADGKARRVKSGVRLLVDGFPNRVGLLRGFGNAIDPRPGAAFIKASRQ